MDLRIVLQSLTKLFENYRFLAVQGLNDHFDQPFKGHALSKTKVLSNTSPSSNLEIVFCTPSKNAYLRLHEFWCLTYHAPCIVLRVL